MNNLVFLDSSLITHEKESESMKKLEIGNFHVKDILFGERTVFRDGILTVNKEEAIASINPDGKLKNIELYVVRPGDSARLVPAKAAVEPRFRPDGRAVFPGYTGPMESAGDGVAYALKDMSVICCGKYSNMVDGMVDMSGPAAEHSVYAKLINLVVYAERTNEKDLDLSIRVETEYRLAAHLLAEYVAKSLKGQTPDDWESYELESGAAEAEKKGLPRVGYFMSVYNQYANNCNDMIYGADSHNMLPIFMHPNEVLDGARASQFGMMGQTTSAYGFQNDPTLKQLYKEHGKTINFVGVILYPTDVSNNMKLRVKNTSGRLASSLKLDGAVVSELVGGSNADVDFFYQLSELEDCGVKTVGIMAEHGGKMMQDSKGDAIISGGDTGAIYELPPMDLVIGDIQSTVRDYFYGSWPVHSEYGPSLRPDGSLIVNMYMIADGGNTTGFLTKSVREF